MKKRWKITLVVAAILAVTTTAAILLNRPVDLLRAPARKEWKEKAMVSIAQRSADTNWLTREIFSLRKKSSEGTTDSEGWLSESLILMKNGEWIAFASKCRKEDARIHDIFIGLGSDGGWYYSTFHFCIGMLSLRIEEQPESLAEFSRAFFVRQFDGRSDDCLSKTWPPKRDEHAR